MMTERMRAGGCGPRIGPGRIGFLLFLFACVPLLPIDARAAEAERVLVHEVVDGDTLRVRSGREVWTVRLIGVDAPEKGHPGKPREFLSGESADFLSSLCDGKEVLLESGREDADSHGRRLRYVFLPGKDVTLVNLEMIRHGYARVLRAFPFSRREEFERAEEEARSGGKGVWKDGGMAEVRWLLGGGASAVLVFPSSSRKFAVVYGDRAKPGVDTRELGGTIGEIVAMRAENADADFAREAGKAGFLPVRADGPPAASADAGESAGSLRDSGPSIPWDRAHLHIGREVTVEGTIVRAHRGKNILFLNFHPNWKRYLTVVIFGKDIASFPQAPEALFLNRVIRVRGTVALHKGRPEIVVTSPLQITVVGGTGR